MLVEGWALGLAEGWALPLVAAWVLVLAPVLVWVEDCVPLRAANG